MKNFKLFFVATLILSAAVFLIPSGAKAAELAVPTGFVFEKNLYYGMKDPDVVYLKIVLKFDGCLPDLITNNTYFGVKTLAAVKCFQNKYKDDISEIAGYPIKATGLVGRATREKLNSIIIAEQGGGGEEEETPPTSQCTESDWTSANTPAICPSSGQQTKTWTKIGNCTGGATHPVSETISCNYQITTCTSFTYSTWSDCSSSGTQSRTVTSSSPSGCQGGSPVTSQTCSYQPTACTPNWQCSWGPCVNGSQSQAAVDSNNCGTTKGKDAIACPALVRACTQPAITNPIIITRDLVSSPAARNIVPSTTSSQDLSDVVFTSIKIQTGSSALKIKSLIAAMKIGVTEETTDAAGNLIYGAIDMKEGSVVKPLTTRMVPPNYLKDIKIFDGQQQIGQTINSGSSGTGNSFSTYGIVNASGRMQSTSNSMPPYASDFPKYGVGTYYFALLPNLNFQIPANTTKIFTIKATINVNPFAGVIPISLGLGANNEDIVFSSGAGSCGIWCTTVNMGSVMSIVSAPTDELRITIGTVQNPTQQDFTYKYPVAIFKFTGASVEVPDPRGGNCPVNAYTWKPCTLSTPINITVNKIRFKVTGTAVSSGLSFSFGIPQPENLSPIDYTSALAFSKVIYHPDSSGYLNNIPGFNVSNNTFAGQVLNSESITAYSSSPLTAGQTLGLSIESINDVQVNPTTAIKSSFPVSSSLIQVAGPTTGQPSLAVSLDSSSPAAQSITENQKNVTLGVFTLSASGSDVNVWKIAFKKIGTCSTPYFASVANATMFVGNTQLAIANDNATPIVEGYIASGNAAGTYTSRPKIFTVPKNSSVKITVKADAKCSVGQTLGVGINMISDITSNAFITNPATTPLISGNLMNIVQDENSHSVLSVETAGVPSSTKTIGQGDKFPIGKFKFSAKEADAAVKKIKFAINQEDTPNVFNVYMTVAGSVQPEGGASYLYSTTLNAGDSHLTYDSSRYNSRVLSSATFESASPMFTVPRDSYVTVEVGLIAASRCIYQDSLGSSLNSASDISTNGLVNSTYVGINLFPISGSYGAAIYPKTENSYPYCQGAQIDSFTVNGKTGTVTVAAGSSPVFAWSATSMTTCSIYNTITNSVVAQGSGQGSVAVNDPDMSTIFPTTYRLTCWGGRYFNQTITVVVDASGRADNASITVSAPVLGDTWKIGDTKRITWTSTGLKSTDTVVFTIVDGADYSALLYAFGNGTFASQGYYDFTLTDALKTLLLKSASLPHSYKIKVTAQPTYPNVPVVANYSKNFTLTTADGTSANTTAKSITITYPKGGEVLRVGGTVRITWTSAGFAGTENVSMSVSSSSVSPYTFVNSNYIKVPISRGYYDWTVPDNPSGSLPAGSNYKMVIYVGATSTQTTGYFTIAK